MSVHTAGEWMDGRAGGRMDRWQVETPTARSEDTQDGIRLYKEWKGPQLGVKDLDSVLALPSPCYVAL